MRLSAPCSGPLPALYSAAQLPPLPCLLVTRMSACCLAPPPPPRRCSRLGYLRFLITLATRGLKDLCLPWVRVIPVTALRLRPADSALQGQDAGGCLPLLRPAPAVSTAQCLVFCLFPALGGGGGSGRSIRSAGREEWGPWY